MYKGFTVALAVSLQIAGNANAADFSNAKRIYVPASLIERRIDYSLTGSGPPTTVTYTRPKISVPQAPRNVRYVQVNGSGYVPPPPPPTSLPSSLTATVLPSTSSPQQVSAPINYKQAAAKVKDFTEKHRASIHSSASQLKARAQQLMQDGRIEEARKLLFSAATITPADRKMLADFSEKAVERAKSLLASYDYDGASRAARQALSAEPGNLTASQILDEALTRLGVNFNDAGQRLKLAHMLYDQGRYDEAAVEYRTSLKIKPTADAHIGLGNIALRANQKATAKQEYREALHIEPTSAAAHRQLGIAQYNDGDMVAASANLSKALGLDPKDKLAGKTLVELWQRQLSRLPTANSHLGLARAYQLSGDLTSAQAEYKEVVRLDPNNPNLPAARQSFKLALARQQAENSLQAAKTLEASGALRDAYKKVYEAVGWNPTDASIRFYQGQLLEKLGQIPQAREAYMHVLRIQPTNQAAAARLKDLPLEVTPAGVAIGQSLAIPGSAASPPPFTKPVSTDSHVGALSGFALQMREHMLAEKDRLQKIEDAAQAALKPASPTGKSGIDELLASIPSSSPSPQAAAPAAPAAPAQAPAVADSGSAGLLAPLSTTATTAQSLVGLTNSIAEFVKGGSTTAAAPGGTAASTPFDVLQKMPKMKSAYQRLLALEEQNKKLKEQLGKLKTVAPAPAAAAAPAQVAPPQVGPQAVPLLTQAPLTAATPQAIAATAVPVPTAVPPAVTAPQIATASPQALPAASAFDSPVLSDNGTVHELAAPPAMAIAPSPNMVQGTFPQILEQAPPVAPDFRTLAPPAPQPATPSPSQVRFELTGIETGFTGVRLSVVLKNEGDVALSVPQEMRALIRYRDAKEATVKVVFSGTSVSPHGELNGSIKVPLDKVDPTADLVLPNLLPTASGNSEVHLTMQPTTKAL